MEPADLKIDVPACWRRVLEWYGGTEVCQSYVGSVLALLAREA